MGHLLRGYQFSYCEAPLKEIPNRYAIFSSDQRWTIPMIRFALISSMVQMSTKITEKLKEAKPWF